MRLPLDDLREKYIPVKLFPEKYGISVAVVMKLVSEGKINKAEFKVPGEPRRSLHVNYEEVLSALGIKEEEG